MSMFSDGASGPLAGSGDRSAAPKPFAERSATEKDEMFEHIANQLIAIADNYHHSRNR